MIISSIFDDFFRNRLSGDHFKMKVITLSSLSLLRKTSDILLKVSRQ